MIQLTNQEDFRTVRRLPFCYLCGQCFIVGDLIDDDHVPPQSVLAPGDREPLILPTQRHCNRAQLLLDEKMGELIGLKHSVAVP
jgi:hypothetical protein